MEEITGRDLEVKRLGAANDDVLSQNNDLLLDESSSSTLHVDRSSGHGNETSDEQTGTVEIDANKSTSEETEEIPKLVETLEPGNLRKNAKFNLRKSLAWNSAFFTSDGVLDADELTTMIEGGDKGLQHGLPGIEEEVYRSMESISTLESDNLSLDCLEAELFEDIRASIPNSNKLSNPSNSIVKLPSAKRDSQPKAPKKVALDSGKRLGARTKDNTTSSIPQPKIISRVNMNSMSESTKRASLSSNHAKKDQDTANKAHVTQKGTQTVKPTTKGSKLTGVIGPRRGMPKPLLSSKSSSLGTSTALKTDPTRPSSSCSNSSSCSSGTDVKVKPSANISRKKVDSKTGKLTSTSTVPQTPSRLNTKNKQPPVNSNLSSSISPASSISEWSSVSSSSTSIINQKATSRSSIDTSGQSDLSIHATDRISHKKGNQSVVMHSSQTSSVSRPPAFQPTGLRMPSPKIGFFDGGKSGARTPNGSMRSQSKLPTGPPKTVSTRFSQTSPNGVKFGKISQPKTPAVATNMKPNPQKTLPKPSQQQQTSKPETKTCPVTSDVSDHKTESSLNICINPSQNVDDDLNKLPNLGNNGYKASDTNGNSMEVSSECLVVVKDDKMVKPITDGSRTPFADKNSASDTNGNSMEVAEKTVTFPFIEGQQNENSEVV